jgi:Fur family ferric uptake transcriptional regulator
LAVLEGAGVVAHHLGAKGLTRFELAEWLAGHHHHLVCIDCGSVSDVDIPGEHEDDVRALVAEIAALASFSPIDHALEIEGRCSRCA